MADLTVTLNADAIDAVGDVLAVRFGSLCEDVYRYVSWENWASSEEKQKAAVLHEQMTFLDALKAGAQAGTYDLMGPAEWVRSILHDAYVGASEGCCGRFTREEERCEMRRALAVADVLDGIGWPKTDDEEDR